MTAMRPASSLNVVLQTRPTHAEATACARSGFWDISGAPTTPSARLHPRLLPSAAPAQGSRPDLIAAQTDTLGPAQPLQSP